LSFGFWYQLISDDDLAYLFDLIRFGEGAAWLQVQDLFDVGVGEDVVTAFDALGEAEGGE
jgi:hypothetical protein